MNSKMIGNLTEINCLKAFTELGYGVSIPFGDCLRYDLIVDIKGKLYKIQCKTANDTYINDGYIVFRCDNTTTKSGQVDHSRYTEDEKDYFATYYNNKCYLVPVGECSREKRLRFTPPANGQTKGISFAEEYELERMVEKLN